RPPGRAAQTTSSGPTAAPASGTDPASGTFAAPWLVARSRGGNRWVGSSAARTNRQPGDQPARARGSEAGYAPTGRGVRTIRPRSAAIHPNSCDHRRLQKESARLSDPQFEECFTRGELRREKTRSSQPLTDASAWATSSSERTLVNGNPPSWRNCRLRKLTCARNGPRRYDRSAQSPARGAARFALRVEHGDKLCQCP